MDVIPAIDLRGGRCVRLYQGDFAQESVFSEDPPEVALGWEAQGALRLHIVDLDGAATGRPENLAVIAAVLARVEVPVQVGGGIRTLDTAQRLVELGVQRLILGTSAVEDPAFVARMLYAFGPEAIVVSVDAREGRAAVRGWRDQSSVRAADLVRQMASLGVHRFVYTDIARDGTLTEPNYDAFAEILALGEPVIASGGVSSAEHLVRLAALGAEAAIVGRALYTGDLDLRQALEAVRSAR